MSCTRCPGTLSVTAWTPDEAWDKATAEGWTRTVVANRAHGELCDRCTKAPGELNTSELHAKVVRLYDGEKMSLSATVAQIKAEYGIAFSASRVRKILAAESVALRPRGGRNHRQHFFPELEALERVEAGEKMGDLAREYGVSYNALWNRLEDLRAKPVEEEREPKDEYTPTEVSRLAALSRAYCDARIDILGAFQQEMMCADTKEERMLVEKRFGMSAREVSQYRLDHMARLRDRHIERSNHG